MRLLFLRIKIFCCFLFHILFKASLKSYTNSCSIPCECNTTARLTCSSCSTNCNCPTSLPAYKCDCQADYYFDSGFSMCRKLKFYIIKKFTKFKIIQSRKCKMVYFVLTVINVKYQLDYLV